MKTLKENMTLSRDACNFLLKTRSMTGANWDQYSGSSQSWEACIGRTNDAKMCQPFKDHVDICVYDRVRPETKRLAKGKQMLGFLRTLGSLAVKNKCGNCGEFSAAAFMYLYDRNIRPLDWCGLKDADHAFVIIGRNAGDASDYTSWGNTAAICDPWAQGFRKGDTASGSYAGTDFKTQMGGLLSFSGVDVMYRAD